VLPDFVDAKREACQALTATLQDQVREDPFLGAMRSRRVFEGDGSVLVDAHGENFTTEMTHFRFDTSVSREDVIALGIDAFIPRTTELAAGMRESQGRALVNALHQVTKQTGNVLTSSGSDAPSFDEFCKMYEKREWIFSPDGTPPTMQIMYAPGSSIEEKVKTWLADPECVARLNEIGARKKAEWDARESNRKLVD
jgi:hypothetical protein